MRGGRRCARDRCVVTFLSFLRHSHFHQFFLRCAGGAQHEILHIISAFFSSIDAFPFILPFFSSYFRFPHISIDHFGFHLFFPLFITSFFTPSFRHYDTILHSSFSLSFSSQYHRLLRPSLVRCKEARRCARAARCARGVQCGRRSARAQQQSAAQMRHFLLPLHHSLTVHCSLQARRCACVACARGVCACGRGCVCV